jgi:hypothetical protein
MPIYRPLRRLLSAFKGLMEILNHPLRNKLAMEVRRADREDIPYLVNASICVEGRLNA